MEVGFAFNWNAITIYNLLEDVSDQENTSHLIHLVRIFQFWLALLTWLEAPFHFNHHIYIYNVDWLTLTWSQAPFHFKNKKIKTYTYNRLQIYICMLKIYSHNTACTHSTSTSYICWRWLCQKRHSYIYLQGELVGVDGRHSTTNIYI